MGQLVLTYTNGFTNLESRTIDMGALTYPTGSTYVRHKAEISSSSPGNWYLSWGGGEQSYTNDKWGNWYSNESQLKNSGYPGEAVLKVRNNTGVYSTVTITLTVEYTNPYTAVTQGSKIKTSDINQTGASVTAGTKIQNSNFSAGTKAEASTFNSRVLGL